VDVGHVIADCKSGVSGAGRKSEIQYLFAEASDNFKSYGVAGHRHLPEILESLTRISGHPVGLTFVPHLTPMIRGMQATLYVRITREAEFQMLYEKRYADEPFVDIMPVGSVPDTRSVRAANTCRIALHRPQGGDTLVILSVIDNLTKGAAGQAVQNMNLMFGLPETLALQQAPLLP
jgi:N-acetyl-gamma-glutamyl-phosphate reductase